MATEDILTKSNTMDATFSLIYKGEDALPFSLKQARNFDWMPFSLMKNPSISMDGTLEVKEIPKKRVRIYPTKDTYARSDYDGINYGGDGQVCAFNIGGIESNAYFSFDLGSIFVDNIKEDLLGVTFNAYNPSTKPLASSANIRTMTNDWYEYDINWGHRIDTFGDSIATISLEKGEAYNSSTELKPYITSLDQESLDNFAFSITTQDNFVCSSRHVQNAPYIEFTFIDRGEMALIAAASYRKFTIVPRLTDYAYIPFGIDLKSKNVAGMLPFNLGVTTTPTLKDFVRNIEEVPFSLIVKKENRSVLPFRMGVTSSGNVRDFVEVVEDINFNIVPRVPASNFIPFSMGVNSVCVLKEQTLLGADLPLTLVPKVRGSNHLSFSLGVTNNFIVRETTLNATDLSMSITPRVTTANSIPFSFGVVTGVVIKDNVLNVSEVPMTATVRVWDDSNLRFELAVLPQPLVLKDFVLNVSELQYDAKVLERVYLPMELNVRGRSYLEFDVSAQPVSSIPFEMGVISPYLSFDLIPRTPAFEYIPFDGVARVRNVSDLPFAIRPFQPGGYAFIM